MKRFLMSSVAAGLSLSMIGAPLALAQSDQHAQHDQHAQDQHTQGQHTEGQHTQGQHTQAPHTQGPQHAQGPQNSPHADEVRPTGPQHNTQAHTTIQHNNGGFGKPTNTMPHQMSQMSHDQQRQGPGQHQPQHMSSNGHQWRHGDRYTGSRNYVTNYNAYHLNAPPPGYQWVQDGSQFVLIAVATGIISSVILQSFNQ